MLNSPRDKIRKGTVVGRVEGSPLYDPVSELYYWEGESSASITINGMGKKRSEVYYCCCNNTIPKQVAPIDSIWTDCCILCNWSMYNFSNRRPV